MATKIKNSDVVAASQLPGYSCGNYYYLKAEGYRYDIHCLNAEHATPGPLSNYYDGRDWAFKSLTKALRACETANRMATKRSDGLRFVVVDMRS
jgi:hypothetical protein